MLRNISVKSWTTHGIGKNNDLHRLIIITKKKKKKKKKKNLT